MATALADVQIFEGTWEEIQGHAAELSGHWLQVKIADKPLNDGKYTPEFWTEKAAAFDARATEAQPMIEVQSFIGYVEDIQDGIASTVLEDDQGRPTYVRFRAEKLKNAGIESRGRFRYTVLDTGNGSASRFEPLPKIKLSQEELQEFAREAESIFKHFPTFNHNATS